MKTRVGKGSSTSYVFQSVQHLPPVSLSLRAFHTIPGRSHRSCLSSASPSFSSNSNPNFPTCLFASPLKLEHPCLTIPRLASLEGGRPYMAWGWSQQVARPTTPLTPPWRLPQYIQYILSFIYTSNVFEPLFCYFCISQSETYCQLICRLITKLFEVLGAEV
jgi:hypothetical protein